MRSNVLSLIKASVSQSTLETYVIIDILMKVFRAVGLIGKFKSKNV
jgi:hypothetical protein